MRKNIIQKIAICVLSGTILISLAACGANQTETKKADTIRTDAIKAKESQKADEAVIGSNKTNSYEKIFEKSVSVDNKKKNILITQNVKDVKDTILKIENEKVALKRVSVDIGYTHCRVKAADVTGDGKEEIILFLRGGASGAVQDIQIFSKENNVWEEIETPDALWKDDFVTFKINKKDEVIMVKATDTKLKIELGDDHGKLLLRGLRDCAVKNGKIVITDDISCDNVGDVIGEVKQELRYSKAKKKFIFGNTAIIWNTIETQEDDM